MSNQLIPTSGLDNQLTGPYDDPVQPPQSQRVRRFLRFLVKFWWIPVLTLFIGIAAEAAFVYWKEPTFVSKASMWETLKLSLPGGTIFSDGGQNSLGTQSDLLQSGKLQKQALERMMAMTNIIEIPRGKDGLPPDVAIRVAGSAKSSVFVIEAKSSNPAFTQNFLDSLMAAYLEYKRDTRKVVSEDTLVSISEQVQRWERDLKAEQDILLAFQRTNNMAILQEEGKISGSYLAKLETQLSEYQLENRLLDARFLELDATTHAPAGTSADSPQAVTNQTGLSEGVLAEIQSNTKDIELLKFQREKLSKYLRPKHPKIVQLDAGIQRAEKLRDIFRKQNREQLLATRQANQMRIDNVRISIKEWQDKVVRASSLIAEAERLRLNVQRVQSVYDRLVALVQSVGIGRNIDQESVAILESAAPPKRSYTAEKNGLVLAVIGGLAVGFGIVFLIAVRDDRFISVTDVNTALGGAVVGLLPEVSGQGDGLLQALEINDPRHVYAEAYRSLRSALLFLATEGERPKVLLVTSAMPNEGKSTIASNLARTLALSGSRVLLVDGDLRKGRLHRLVGMKEGPGLAELLDQNSDPAKVMQTDSLPNFCFISRGKVRGNPGDLFLSSNLDQVLARWRKEFDYVVIDSSPLFAADDASCLAPKVDGTLFVVRSHHSSERAVREALDLLAQRQARVLGVILNGADASARSYYYYKYADYGPPANPG